jgi:orotidine-5'-phosphate decarboxylase
MIEAVAKELAQIPAKRPKILGVTVLTSFDDKSWSEVNQACSDRPNTIIAESASRLMTAGTQWGVDGVVCSAHELKNFRTVNPYLYTVVPGIRPDGATSDDQARVMTPAQARVLGASAIVVGRPITLAASARQVGELILSDLRD